MRHGAYVLVVEDNPADSMIIAGELTKGTGNTHVIVAKDGVEAIKYLPGKSATDAPKPDLIILDLNMPKKDGRALLKEIKTSSLTKCIPTVVLTSSEADIDINEAYSSSANSYFSKPMDLDEYNRILDRIKQYWLADAKLPSACLCPTENEEVY